MELWQIVLIAVVGIYFMVGFIGQRFDCRVRCSGEGECTYEEPHGGHHAAVTIRLQDRLIYFAWGPLLGWAGYGAFRRIIRWIVIGT